MLSFNAIKCQPARDRTTTTNAAAPRTIRGAATTDNGPNFAATNVTRGDSQQRSIASPTNSATLGIQGHEVARPRIGRQPARRKGHRAGRRQKDDQRACARHRAAKPTRWQNEQHERPGQACRPTPRTDMPPNARSTFSRSAVVETPTDLATFAPDRLRAGRIEGHQKRHLPGADDRDEQAPSGRVPTVEQKTANRALIARKMVVIATKYTGPCGPLASPASAASA